MRYYVTLPSSEELVVDVVELPTGRTEVRVDGEAMAVDACEADGALHVVVGARVFDIWLEADGADPSAVRVVTGAGLQLRARVDSEQRRATLGGTAAAGGSGRVSAPMPGRVVRVLVKPGDVVAAGVPVVVVEAMKMENELRADRGGTVAAVHAIEGQNVEGGATLVEVA